MAQYIDKDALVAEIKRRRKLVSDPILSGNDLMIGERNAFFNLLSFIDTLEVKEMDFETAFAASVDHFDEKNNYGQWPESDLREIAEHFFKLGLNYIKSNKNE